MIIVFDDEKYFNLPVEIDTDLRCARSISVNAIFLCYTLKGFKENIWDTFRINSDFYPFNTIEQYFFQRCAVDGIPFSLDKCNRINHIGKLIRYKAIVNYKYLTLDVFTGSMEQAYQIFLYEFRGNQNEGASS